MNEDKFFVLFLVLFIAALLIVVSHQNKQADIDRAIICMEATADTHLCRIQAGLKK